MRDKVREILATNESPNEDRSKIVKLYLSTLKELNEVRERCTALEDANKADQELIFNTRRLAEKTEVEKTDLGIRCKRLEEEVNHWIARYREVECAYTEELKRRNSVASAENNQHELLSLEVKLLKEKLAKNEQVRSALWNELCDSQKLSKQQQADISKLENAIKQFSNARTEIKIEQEVLDKERAELTTQTVVPPPFAKQDKFI
jgi:hypothetical protein